MNRVPAGLLPRPSPVRLTAQFWRARIRFAGGLLAATPWHVGLAFLAPLAIYILTLAPTIYNLDSAELTTAAATGGLLRSTGYPLYLIIGRFWSRMPLGDVGYRMNLLSAVMGSLTVGGVALILRQIHVGRLATIAAVGLLATAPYFWSLSLVAEVYTLHTALMTSLILAVLFWSRRPGYQTLGLVGLIVGLSLSHHLATALLVPGVIWFLLWSDPRRALRPGSILAAMGGLLLGLSLYLYLPYLQAASPAFNYAGVYDASGIFHPVNLQTPGGLWWLISGQAFATQMFAYTAGELIGEAWWLIRHIWRAFFFVGLGPGILGSLLVFRRNRALGGMLLLMFAFSAGFYLQYRVVDKDTMFLPAYVIWALWLGIAFQWLLNLLGARDPADLKTGLLTALKITLIGSVLAALAWNWKAVDLSNDYTTRERGEAILAAAAPEALVLGWWDTVPVIQYLQLVEGKRPDITPMNLFLIDRNELRALVLAQLGQRPIYLDGPASEIDGRLRGRPAGPLFEIQLREPDQ